MHITLHAHAPHSPDNQDPILFKNLLKKPKQSLLQKHSESEVTTLLEPFVALESDEEFWRNTSDGLAVLGTIDVQNHKFTGSHRRINRGF
jgi:hypothetical protein